MNVLSKSFILLLVYFFWVSSLAAAPKYVQAPPLQEAVAKVKVGEVRSKGALQVPIITWGGDLATLLANGKHTTTAAGSLFAQKGLQFKLVREDVFAQQVQAYMEGTSPYLRGTLGMINMAAEVLNQNPKTRPVIIYQMSWSVGGDALVVKPGIESVKDLRGKTLALQAYGPHVDYMTKVLESGGLSPKDVTIRWLPDLTGTANSPMMALQQQDVDAAFVVIPDALTLTSGGQVGTGAEDSVKGARILLSTKTANRIIADVYAVRSDYLKKHRAEVEHFVHGLLLAEQELKGLMEQKDQQFLKMAGEVLLDSSQAVADIEGLYSDCEFVGWPGNVDFLANPSHPRSLENVTKEIQKPFIELGLLTGSFALSKANWDYDQLRSGLQIDEASTVQRFNQQQVAELVVRRQQTGSLNQGELFRFEIFFQPNQNTFSVDLYQDSFERVVNYATTYGGALITIEGHSDPMEYLRQKKNGASELVLGQIKQSAKNLSLSRALAVRDSIMSFADKKHISLDVSQFAVVGHGIANPSSGICGTEPCAPSNEQQWRENMRVEFRILQVEAEAEVFNPL
jgi:ABC-type nitrate/sulfonate/bicarbonate transport system substrate-binding protein/outer membrane protein OmpA-like peptidoglycan-associated protein